MDEVIEYTGKQLRDECIKNLPFQPEIADRIVRILGGVVTASMSSYFSSQSVFEAFSINSLTFGISEILRKEEPKSENGFSSPEIKNLQNAGNVLRWYLLFAYGFCYWINGTLDHGNLMWMYAYFAIDTSDK